MRTFKIILLIFTIIPSFAYADTLFESQTGILYTGNAGITSDAQPFGTGYTTTISQVSIDTFTGNASTTITLQECPDGTYTSCTDKATTGSFATISDTGGTASSTANFITPFTFNSSKYYRLFVSASSLRLQCGNTSAITPTAGADAGQCGASSRAWYFLLYSTTTPTSSNTSTLFMSTTTDAIVGNVFNTIYVGLWFFFFIFIFYLAYRTAGGPKIFKR